MIEYYRVVSGAAGIYEAVDRDCPRDDPRRADKPDGLWLPKVGQKFTGAISFWTRAGLDRYDESGLLHWHASVVCEAPRILLETIHGSILYSDLYQAICQPEAADIVSELDLQTYMRQRS